MLSEMAEEMERDVFSHQIEETLLEKYDTLCELVKLQAETNMDLVSLLIQHKDVDDAAFALIKAKIDEATMIRAENNL